MEKYKFNATELHTKMISARELLNKDLTSQEREKVEMSLLAYINLLNTTVNVNLNNFLDKITKGKYSQRQYNKAECLTSTVNEILVQKIDYTTEEYLHFLLKLVDNIATPYLESSSYEKLNVSDDQMLEVSNSFFNYLNDAELKQYYNKIVLRPNAIAITSLIRLGNENFKGVCNYDYLNSEPYITVIKQNDINDLYILSHEMIHGIDFLMKPKLYSETHYGFHETVTYAFEYLIADYLEKQGYEKNEIDKLRNEKVNYICGLAYQIQMQIKHKLRAKGIDIKNGYDISDIKQILDVDLMKNLLEVQSGIMAYGFYEQILIDKNSGLDNLKRFMKSNISKDKTPDFSSFDLSNDKLLSLSETFKKEATEVKHK